MDQSKSNNPHESGGKKPHTEVKMPRRNLSIEFFVGVFTMLGVAAAGYLAVGLGNVRLSDSDRYDLYAEFDNISGLKYGASVEIAGVPVGEVAAIDLKDPVARVTLRLDKAVRIRDDDVFSIRTKGIIGDRYVKISRGGSDRMIEAGGTTTETESVIDIEDVIGKVVHSLTGDKDDKDKDAKSDK